MVTGVGVGDAGGNMMNCSQLFVAILAIIFIIMAGDSRVIDERMYLFTAVIYEFLTNMEGG